MDHVKTLHKIKEMAWRELEALTESGELSERSLERAYKLVKIIKNGGEAEMLEEYGEYSEDDGYSQRGRRGTHYVRGHYSRNDGGSYNDGGSSYNRDGYNRSDRYSRGEDSEMIEEIREMIEKEHDPEKKEAAKKFLRILEG
jgi:hypothetical protein